MPIPESSVPTSKGAERCALLLEVATDLFVKHGYEQVSLDQIVEQAGGSKATIYKYFGNKKGLFLAICRHRQQRFIVQIERACQQDQLDIRRNLCQLLYNLYLIFNDEKSAAFMRLFFHIARQEPALAQQLYQQGPDRAQQLLADFLAHAHRKGQLYCMQPKDSAMYFFGFFHDMFWRALMGLPPAPPTTSIEQHIGYVVDRFIEGHQVPR